MDERTQWVLKSVQEWTPNNERAVVSRERTIGFLNTAIEPFSREADISHITGSAIVLSSAGTLLHKHKRDGIWIGPGGHVDEGEFPWDSAVRETWEETGIKAWHPLVEPTLVHVDVHDTGMNHIHYDLRYVLVAKPDEPSPPPEESPDVYWIHNDDALLLTDNSYLEALIAAHGLLLEMP